MRGDRNAPVPVTRARLGFDTASARPRLRGIAEPVVTSSSDSEEGSELEKFSPERAPFEGAGSEAGWAARRASWPYRVFKATESWYGWLSR